MSSFLAPGSDLPRAGSSCANSFRLPPQSSSELRSEQRGAGPGSIPPAKAQLRSGRGCSPSCPSAALFPKRQHSGPGHWDFCCCGHLRCAFPQPGAPGTRTAAQCQQDEQNGQHLTLPCDEPRSAAARQRCSGALLWGYPSLQNIVFTSVHIGLGVVLSFPFQKLESDSHGKKQKAEKRRT